MRTFAKIHTLVSGESRSNFSLIIIFQSFQNGLGGPLALYHVEEELEQKHELANWAVQISFQAILRIQKLAMRRSVSHFQSD